MKFEANLIFRGQCEAAFRHYEAVFGGHLLLLHYKDSPLEGEVPKDWSHRIAHATLSIGDESISGADAMTETARNPDGFYLIVNPPSLAETHRVFGQLAEGGEVVFPVQQTFFSKGYGITRDRFGISWKVSCASED